LKKNKEKSELISQMEALSQARFAAEQRLEESKQLIGVKTQLRLENQSLNNQILDIKLASMEVFNQKNHLEAENISLKVFNIKI